jgi:hypothetical protein
MPANYGPGSPVPTTQMGQKMASQGIPIFSGGQDPSIYMAPPQMGSDGQPLTPEQIAAMKQRIEGYPLPAQGAFNSAMGGGVAPDMNPPMMPPGGNGESGPVGGGMGPVGPPMQPPGGGFQPEIGPPMQPPGGGFRPEIGPPMQPPGGGFQPPPTYTKTIDPAVAATVRGSGSLQGIPPGGGSMPPAFPPMRPEDTGPIARVPPGGWGDKKFPPGRTGPILKPGGGRPRPRLGKNRGPLKGLNLPPGTNRQQLVDAFRRGGIRGRFGTPRGMFSASQGRQPVR